MIGKSSINFSYLSTPLLTFGTKSGDHCVLRVHILLVAPAYGTLTTAQNKTLSSCYQSLLTFSGLLEMKPSTY